MQQSNINSKMLLLSIFSTIISGRFLSKHFSCNVSKFFPQIFQICGWVQKIVSKNIFAFLSETEQIMIPFLSCPLQLPERKKENRF